MHRTEVLGLAEEPGPVQPGSLRRGAEDGLPGEDPVLAAEQGHRRIRGRAPGLDLVRGRAIAVPGHHATDPVGMRPNQQLAMHRPDKRRAELDRVRTVRSAGGHVAIPRECDRQVMTPFVTLVGEANRVHADVLLPYVVHAPMPGWHRGCELTRRQAGEKDALFRQLLIRRIRAWRLWRASIAERDCIREAQAAQIAESGVG